MHTVWSEGDRTGRGGPGGYSFKHGLVIFERTLLSGTVLHCVSLRGPFILNPLQCLDRSTGEYLFLFLVLQLIDYASYLFFRPEDPLA